MPLLVSGQQHTLEKLQNCRTDANTHIPMIRWLCARLLLSSKCPQTTYRFWLLYTSYAGYPAFVHVFFLFFPLLVPYQRPGIFPQKLTMTSRGCAPHPLLMELHPPTHTQVDAECLAAVVTIIMHIAHSG